MKVLFTRLSRFAAIAFTAALALPLLLNGRANAQNAQIQGVINGRSGATMTVQTH
jgi:hypothetical protein